jgi:DtxR family Mn-dependent transcriptional regulator
MDQDNIREELLEFIWTEREQGSNSIDALLKIEEVSNSGANLDSLFMIQKEGLIKVDKNTVTLTDEGDKLAEKIVRRHRLAERLLSDVLDIDESTLDIHACNFEHSISVEVAESICSLLGHPPSCPHGHPIPKGDCCVKTSSLIKPLVIPLTELGVGSEGRVSFIVPKTSKRLEKLGSMGLVPGSIVKLVQKKPAYVIQLGQTTLALEADIVEDIFVKKK